MRKKKEKKKKKIIICTDRVERVGAHLLALRRGVVWRVEVQRVQRSALPRRRRVRDRVREAADGVGDLVVAIDGHRSQLHDALQ